MATFDYAPAPESRSVVDIKPAYGLFVGGGFLDSVDGTPFKTVNPATEEVLSEVMAAGPQDIEKAVAAARTAFAGWSALPGHERAKYLYRLARLLQERARELAVLETLDNGKPIRESRDVDIPLAAAHFFYHAGWADKLGYAGFGAGPRPLGVAGQVIPWNFPLLMLAWKIAPALACGNTVVLKPAETTPLTALMFAGICQQADLPPGVVNIVTGGGETGRLLVEHPGIDKVAFTGSTEVGRQIARSVAGTAKRATLELGGKAANVVFDDAPIEQAVEGIVNGIFFNQGHVCCAGSRLLVQESIADDVLDRLKHRLGTLRLGDPLDKNTDIGAINSPEQLDRIRLLSDVGEQEGAERWSAPCELPDRGWWFPPTVFTGVSQAHRIAREEVFGPVLSVLTFRTPAEAVEKANNTPYGLSAGVWTEKGSRILWMAQQLRAGVVWANTFNRFDPSSPFGGYKESGYGREGGRHGLASYLATAHPPGSRTEQHESSAAATRPDAKAGPAPDPTLAPSADPAAVAGAVSAGEARPASGQVVSGGGAGLVAGDAVPASGPVAGPATGPAMAADADDVPTAEIRLAADDRPTTEARSVAELADPAAPSEPPPGTTPSATLSSSDAINGLGRGDRMPSATPESSEELQRASMELAGLSRGPRRQPVHKTYKLFVGGAFPRSESGRSYVVQSAVGDRFLANAALASRKDARDAVVAARAAFSRWSAATAYNRGQILYRVAEMLEGRRAQFVAEVVDAEGMGRDEAAAVVDAVIDRWVWYAGWSDKVHQVHGSSNPVAGPYFDFSVPEPTGVVAVVAPQRSSFLGLVSVVAPVIVSANTCVVLASERAPLPAITLAEVLAIADLPGGVVNLLTGRVGEVAPWLASHMDVNALDLCGVDDPDAAAELETLAAENLKRVRRPPAGGEPDWSADPGVEPIVAFLETKTVWHPVGI